MNSNNELNRSNVEAPVAANAPEAAVRIERYRPRENGVGYGRSSGYARTRSFVAPRANQALRCR